MPGTSTSSCSWSPERIAPMRNKNSSGRTKLKKAADGLRQNILRSRRYWCQARAAASGTDGHLLRGDDVGRVGGQLQVDVLERGAHDGQLGDGGAAGDGGGGQLV